jgi:D-alanyl-D-alanine carboxypeptidase (penicillin-binding protein 5/6)
MKHRIACLLVAFAFLARVAAADQIETTANVAYIVDFQTGAVLLDKNGDQQIEPASMSKLMTVYLLFEALKSGKVKMSDSFPVSERAWRTQGSKMFVELHNQIKVEDLLQGIVVQSGNDACVVIAEGMAGSVEAFAERENATAKRLGLTHSHFMNPDGWPDPQHFMTAHDLTILARDLIIEFPEYYHYFSQIDFTYHGIKQGNRNPLLYKNVGVDGLKTGHAEGPGYGLVASGARDGRRIIMVVQGTDSKQARSDETLQLWEWAFRNFDNYKIVKANAPLVDAKVWLGAQETVPLAAQSDLIVTLPRGTRDQVKATAVFDGPLPAPVVAGTTVGKLRIEAPGMAPMEVPLITAGAVPLLGTFDRIMAAARHLIRG